MSLSNPRAIYGIHSVTPYSRTTGLPYGMLRVLAGSQLALAGDLVELRGGSSKYPWAIEDAAINCEMSLKVKEYPDFLFELFLGKAPTSATADTSGAVTALTNKNGSSCMHATTGIASVSVKAAEKADLKFTRYVVVVTGAEAVDVYAMSNIDFARGVDKDFVNNALKITASPLTIVASTAVEIPDFGLELTGGSGTIGMTVGDTATFEVKPPSSESMSVRVGATTNTFPEFGAILVAQRRSSNEMFELDAFRCKGVGLPIAFDENKWSEADIKAKIFYDSAKDGIFDVRNIIVT